MDGFTARSCVAAVAFASGVGGLVLHQTLPEKFASGALRDMTGAVGGLLTLLTALVLGLLIWSAYRVFATQAGAVRSLATQILQLDLALADYGPDAAPVRTLLRESVKRSLGEIWSNEGDENFVARSYGATIANLHDRQACPNSLHPTTEAQKQALAPANQAVTSISQTRLRMAVALMPTRAASAFGFRAHMAAWPRSR
jgi:hypothetical protein